MKLCKIISADMGVLLCICCFFLSHVCHEGRLLVRLHMNQCRKEKNWCKEKITLAFPEKISWISDLTNISKVPSWLDLPDRITWKVCLSTKGINLLAHDLPIFNRTPLLYSLTDPYCPCFFLPFLASSL